MPEPTAGSPAPDGRRARGRPAGVDGADTRAALLRAATVRLGAVGYERMNLDDVASDVGITRSAIYRYFGSKQELARAAVLEFSPEVEARYAELSHDAAGLGDELRAFVRACIVQSIEDPEPSLGYYEAGRLAAHDESMAHVFHERSQYVRTRIETLVDAAVERGELSDDRDRAVIVETVSGLIWAMAHGASAAPNARVRDQITLAVDAVLRRPAWLPGG